MVPNCATHHKCIRYDLLWGLYCDSVTLRSSLSEIHSYVLPNDHFKVIFELLITARKFVYKYKYNNKIYLETIVGVNKYKLEKEEEVDVLIVDNTKVRESQVIHLFSYILWKRLVGFCKCFVFPR